MKIYLKVGAVIALLGIFSLAGAYFLTSLWKKRPSAASPETLSPTQKFPQPPLTLPPKPPPASEEEKAEAQHQTEVIREEHNESLADENFKLGNELLAEKNYAEAEREFKQVAEQTSKIDLRLTALGLVLKVQMITEEFYQAEKTHKEILRISEEVNGVDDKKHKHILEGLVNLHMNRHQYQAAAPLLDRLAAVDPKFRKRQTQNAELEKKSLTRVWRAKMKYERLLKENDSSPVQQALLLRARCDLAHAYTLNGDFTRARMGTGKTYDDSKKFYGNNSHHLKLILTRYVYLLKTMGIKNQEEKFARYLTELEPPPKRKKSRAKQKTRKKRR